MAAAQAEFATAIASPPLHGVLKSNDSVTLFFSRSYGLSASGGSTTNVNTVNASANSVQTTDSTSAHASATGIVVAASVKCTGLTLFSSEDQDGTTCITDTNGVTTCNLDANVQLPFGSVDVPITL